MNKYVKKYSKPIKIKSIAEIDSVRIEIIFQFLSLNDSNNISSKIGNKKLFSIYNQLYLR